jgi:hypothetical protein
MAKKVKSFIEISGTFQGKTYVDSKTYGMHLRAARGSVAPVDVNEAFKRSGDELVRANIPAKIILHAIDLYRVGWRKGLFWQALVGRFKGKYTRDGVIDFSVLEGMDVYREHPLDRHLTVRLDCAVDRMQGIVTAQLTYDAHPAFMVADKADGYQLSLIGIFPDLKEVGAETVLSEFPYSSLAREVSDMQATIALPEGYQVVVFCLKMVAYRGKDVVANEKTRAIKILKVVRLQA